MEDLCDCYSGIGRRIRGEPGAARAFCGIDYSLLSRCTSRVKSAPLSAPTPSPSSLFLLPSRPVIPLLSLPVASLSSHPLSHFYALFLPLVTSTILLSPLTLPRIFLFPAPIHLHVYTAKRRRRIVLTHPASQRKKGLGNLVSMERLFRFLGEINL